jgi:hypothetical protein
MDKRNIGQFLSIKFEFTSETVIYTGYVIDFSEDWTLLKHCLFDYLVDGYILLNNKYITEFKRGCLSPLKSAQNYVFKCVVRS